MTVWLIRNNRPFPLLTKYVEAGWLGAKRNGFFMDYRGDVLFPQGNLLLKALRQFVDERAILVSFHAILTVLCYHREALGIKNWQVPRSFWRSERSF